VNKPKKKKISLNLKFSNRAERLNHIFHEKEMTTCGRKERQENKIGENLSREKRKKEKMPVRRKNSIE
jgi:hypothetical protein